MRIGAKLVPIGLRKDGMASEEVPHQLNKQNSSQVHDECDTVEIFQF
jgi:hypothetical protein